VIMKMRFDPMASPQQSIPRSLRKPLYSIVRKHAAGAVRREGRAWVDFDPVTDESFDNPYPFDDGDDS